MSSNQHTNNSNDDSSSNVVVYDVVIVGGGVVGLSVLRQATLLGYKACCVEQEDALLHWASGSNSGIICTGVDAPMGSLERALIRESIAQVRVHCQQFQIPFRDCGSLVCQWPWDSTKETSNDNEKSSNSNTRDEYQEYNKSNNGEYQEEQEGEENVADKLDRLVQDCHEAGDMQAKRLTPEEVQGLEPSLNPTCVGAVYIPGEIVVDPWMFAISFATHARENGAQIYTNFQVDLESSSLDTETNLWTLRRKETTTTTTTTDDKTTASTSPLVIQARAVVNATGAWADVVEQRLTGSSSFHIQPRRGQYRMFLGTESSTPTGTASSLTSSAYTFAYSSSSLSSSSSSSACQLTMPIQPIPTQRTKGIFLFSTLYNQIVVGPTAEDQLSRDDRSLDEQVRDKLTKTAKKLLPNLNTSISVGEYVGIRPGLTQYRDYQIQLNVEKRWVVCAGIRSTGLTASLGIGRHVIYLLQQGILPSAPSLHPYHKKIQTTPLPPIRELVYDFHRHNGHVEIGGHSYRVTHPITIHGWKLRTGLAGSSSSTGTTGTATSPMASSSSASFSPARRPPTK